LACYESATFNTTTCQWDVTGVPLTASTTQVNVLCNGNTTGSIDLTVTGGTGPYTYSWNTTPVQTTQDLSNLGAGSYTATITDDNGCSTTASVTITEPTQLNATLDGQTNITCYGGNNGSVVITPTGGVGPYTISPSQNNLIAGAYTFTVTDENGCQVSVPATITQPASNLNVSIATQNNVSCNGLNDGSVILSISGGSAPYTTSPSTTNLSPGAYTFTVTDDNGCSATVSTTITEPLILVAQASNTPITASGGTSTVTVTASGGTGPYTGTGTYNVQAGTYTYTVTDFNGCSDVVTITVTEPLPLTASSIATAILCNGGTSQITVSGNGGTAPYSGTGTFTVSVGTYTYTVTDFYGNTSNTTITVSEPALLTASSSSTAILCNGNTSIVTIGATGGTQPYSGTGSFSELAGLYLYLVTDANGCSSQTSISITQPSPIATSATVVDIYCLNGTGSIDLTVSGGVGPYDVLWNNTINSEDLTNISAGTYTAVVTDQNNCQQTVSYSVVNSFAPTPILTNNTGTTLLTCSTSSISYSITNTSSILWDGGSYPTSTNNTFSTPGQYTLNVTDANACPLQFVVNITQNINPPNAGINSTPNTTVLTCANPIITVQATGGVSYQWSNGLGTNANQSLSQVGTYTVTVTGSNGCTSTASITLTSNQTAPTAVITNNTGSTTLHCNQTQINVTASGGVSYQWSNGLGTNPTVNLTSAGTYTVTVTDANGCTDTETISITQASTPTVSVNPPINICSGSSGVLTAVGSTAGGTYSWTCSNATTSSISISPSTNGICQVIYYDIYNCPSNTATTTYTVIQTPLVNVSGTSTICSGNTATVTAVASLPGGTYSWTPTAPPTATISVTPSQTTTYNVTYTLNGCSSTSVGHTVNVNQTPIVTSNNVGMCNGETAILTASSNIPGGTYSWNTIPVQSTASISVQPIVTSTYTVTYTAPNNCPGTSTSVVTVTDIPTVQLDDITICEGQSGLLTAVPSVAGGTFTWTPGGPGGAELSVSPDQSTQYSVIYTLNNCPSPADNAMVTVINTPSVVASDQTICLGQSATLTAIGSPSGGTYQWSTTETSSSILVDPASNTEYDVTYFYNGCPSALETVSVFVESIPTVTFDVNATEGCLPLTVNFTNTTPNSANCTWNINGASFVNCGPMSYTFQEAGCFDISLTTDSPNGCTNTITMDELICAYPNPIADFNLSTNTIFDGNNTIGIQNTSSGGIEYIWNYGDETSDTLYSPESHTYGGTLQSSYLISLIAISEQGCIDSTSQLITVSDDVVMFAPNTFIPDGDGLNDSWMPVFSSGFNIENYELMIFNRWGQVVFETKDYLQGWDGKFSGIFVQDGVYSFKIKFRLSSDKINQIHVGHINLLR
jgi:gliding motility-associated-like protein